jgi:hypothetical protein
MTNDERKAALEKGWAIAARLRDEDRQVLLDPLFNAHLKRLMDRHLTIGSYARP